MLRPRQCWARVLALLAGLACEGVAEAVTRFEVVSNRGDPIGRGDDAVLSSPEAAFTGFYGYGGGTWAGVSVDKFASPGLIEASWTVEFASRDGLKPGTYENAGDDAYGPVPDGQPVLRVVHGTRPSTVECPRTIGRFTIHAIDWVPVDFGTALRGLAADFEIRCEGKDGLRGSIDYRAGDRGCDGATDGAACDDANPCSTDDGCVAGSCEGTSTLTCRDGVPTTDDVCRRHVGCTFPPAASVWETRGRVAVTATGPGGSSTRRSRTSGVLILFADGTYANPSSVVCNGAEHFVSVEGGWRAGRAGRLRLDRGNTQDLADALFACDGRIERSRVVGVRHSVRVGGPCRRRVDPARRICGRSRLRIRVRALGQTVSLTVDERYAGERVDDGEYAPPR